MEPIALDRGALAKNALIPLAASAGPRCPRCGVKLLAESKTCPRCKVDPSSADAAALLVPEGSMVGELLRGAAYVPRGLLRILATPRLWAVSALPLLLNIIIFVCVTILVISVFGGWLKDHASAEAFADWHGWFWGSLGWILKLTGTLFYYLQFIMVPIVTAWLMGAVPFVIVLRAIFAPFATMVGERTEQIVLNLEEAKKPFNLGELQASITIAIIDTILLGLVQALLYLILLPLAFLFPPLWMVLPPAIMAGMDHTDPTFCRKNYYMRERTALWKARRWRFLGFGLTFFFLLGIPFVNAVIYPVAACGAALLYLELDRK